ncbi:tyrosine-type recombinase/integrase [Clostridium sp. AF32-12BH]|uniref:site-specific integrase n=1 Tax=Clostridium sp. AF32-12BH TaxID=2292006 RepID=UPI000E54EB81|nr:tyrosine-type recombinase/integrase [Clostridium sp. AF32-12BH]RHP45331.1 site-specific integrase [Clostridium sp. AF32-12BH]
MGEVIVKQRLHKSTGKIVYEYAFEVASIDGKRKRKTKSGFKTKKEAREAGKLAQQAYEKVGVPIEPSTMSYSDFLDEWIEKSCKLTCKDVTVKGYEKKIRLYVKPRIGQYRVKSITKKILQDVLIDLFNEGFSQNTLSSIRAVFTKSFEYAEDNHYIQTTPAVKLTIPTAMQPKVQTRTKKHIYIPEDKRKMIFDRFPEGTTTYIPMQIAYRTGLRLGEVYGLVWEDIDFEHKTLSVNRQVQWFTPPPKPGEKRTVGGKRDSDGYWYFSTPKWSSYRTIDIDDELIEILLKEKQKQNKGEAYYAEYFTRYYCQQHLSFNGKKPQFSVMPMNEIQTDKTPYEIHFVTRRDNGTYVTTGTTKHSAHIIHHQLNYPEYDFHSWRHTHGTMLLENGADLTFIQRRLGHKNLDTTLNIYTNHLTQTIHDRSLQKLNGMFQPDN